MTRAELMSLAWLTLKGTFGNGDHRRLALGKNYKSVQRIVDVVCEEADENH